MRTFRFKAYRPGSTNGQRPLGIIYVRAADKNAGAEIAKAQMAAYKVLGALVPGKADVTAWIDQDLRLFPEAKVLVMPGVLS